MTVDVLGGRVHHDIDSKFQRPLQIRRRKRVVTDRQRVLSFRDFHHGGQVDDLHHGIAVSNAFMRAVEADEEWALTSPHDGAVQKTVSARELWIRMLTARIETGEPYILNIDHVNNAIPEHHKLAGLNVKTSKFKLLFPSVPRSA